jgi:hypothetical protein
MLFFLYIFVVYVFCLGVYLFYNFFLIQFCCMDLWFIHVITPEIATTFKNSIWWRKNIFLASCSLIGKMSCLRSCHLVLWSLETLHGQQILSLIKRPTCGRLYCWFCLKLLRVCWILLWWSTRNIPNPGVNEYLTMNTSNSSVGKYYVVKEKNV